MGWLFVIAVLLLVGGMYAIPFIIMGTLYFAYAAVQSVTFVVGVIGMGPCFIGYVIFWWYNPKHPLYHPFFKDPDAYHALGSVLSGIIAVVYTFIHITTGTMLHAFGVSVGVGLVVMVIGFVGLFFKYKESY